MAVYDDEQKQGDGFQSERQTAKKADTPEELKAAEQNGDQPARAEGTEADKLSRLGDQVGKGFTGAAAVAATGGIGGVAQVLLRGAKSRKGVVGGGIGGGLIVVLILGVFFGGSLELISLRENLIGQGNKYVNQSLSQRLRRRSLPKILRSMKNGDLKGIINNPKLQDKFSRNGFQLEFDEQGKLKRFAFEGSNGTAKELDLGASDFKAAANEFFDGEVGKQAETAMQRTISAETLTWKGKAALTLYQKFHFSLSNWLDHKNSDKATTDAEKLNEDLRNAPKDEALAAPEENPTKPGDEVAKENTTDPKAPTALDAAQAEGGSGTLDVIKGASEYADELQNDPTIGDEQTAALKGVTTAADDVLADAGQAVVDDGLKNGGEGALRGILAKMATKLPGRTAVAALKGVDPVFAAQTACRLKGTLRFVANARNVMLAIELARFSMRFLTAADHQKAGLLTSEQLKLLMLYMHRPNPTNGKSYYQSGGVQKLLGNSSAKVSPANLARYSVGRSNGGILGSLANFIDRIPFTGKTGCRIVSNGFVLAGGFAVGVVFAVFGGSETGISQLFDGTTIALTIGTELAFQLGTPLLIKSGAHMVFNGLENGEMVGDGLGSGFGALKGMNGNINGLRPLTKPQAALMDQQIGDEHKVYLAHESIFQRYLNVYNTDSMANHVALALPHTPGGLMGSLSSIGRLFVKPFSLLGNVGNWLMPAKVKAATDSPTCNDALINRYNLATDDFCNIEVGRDPGLDPNDT